MTVVGDVSDGVVGNVLGVAQGAMADTFLMSQEVADEGIAHSDTRTGYRQCHQSVELNIVCNSCEIQIAVVCVDRKSSDPLNNGENIFLGDDTKIDFPSRNKVFQKHSSCFQPQKHLQVLTG